MARYSTTLGRYSYTLQQSITTLHTRMKSLNHLTFTHDEFLALFAPPEHWEMLKTVAEIAEVNANGGYHAGSIKHKNLNANSITAYFNVHDDQGKVPPLLPRNAVVLKTAPKELVDKLVTWANREVEVGLEFARCQAILEWLNVNCATKGQMRFLWPPIVSICSLNEYTAELADRLREFKAPRALPALPVEVKAACRSTGGVITTAMLLPEDVPVNKGQVTVTLSKADVTIQEGALGSLVVCT